MLKITDLSIGYTGKSLLLQPFSFSAETGQLIAVIGTNGSGKSTLLKTLAGLIKPFEGKIEINGNELSTISPARRTALLSLILSNTGMIPDIKVLDVVKMGRFAHKGWT
ncbi:MAG: cobalamin/Fe3+-siderophore ABC transporter ATP-binding protein, partial [Bacteroidetes bacterium HGW-Bacteroidetes-21]